MTTIKIMRPWGGRGPEGKKIANGRGCWNLNRSWTLFFLSEQTFLSEKNFLDVEVARHKIELLSKASKDAFANHQHEKLIQSKLAKKKFDYNDTFSSVLQRNCLRGRFHKTLNSRVLQFSFHLSGVVICRCYTFSHQSTRVSLFIFDLQQPI